MLALDFISIKVEACLASQYVRRNPMAIQNNIDTKVTNRWEFIHRHLILRDHIP